MVAGPEISRLISQFEEYSSRRKNTDDRHHDNSMSMQKDFIDKVRSLKTVMNDYGNPFLEDSEDIYKIDSKDIVQAGTGKLSQIKQIGCNQYADFRNRMQNTASIYEPIKKNKFLLFSRQPKKSSCETKSKLDLAREDCSLFSRLFISCQSRQCDLEEFFSHENQKFPPSLSQSGKINIFVKSQLMEFQEAKGDLPREEPQTDMVVVDGAAMVNSRPPRGTYTFDEYAKDVILPVHVWVGGSMLGVNTAPSEPVFFLHHCFIDYVWEQFRQRQTVDPETDYPFDQHAPPSQAPNRIMDNLETGKRNIDGYSNDYTDQYYRNLTSRKRRSTGDWLVYEPFIEEEIVSKTGRTKRSINSRRSNQKKRKSHITNMDSSMQNSFLLDGEPDIKRWVFIPVKIVHRRPSGLLFGTKVIRNKNIVDGVDVYSYNKYLNYTDEEQQAAYSHSFTSGSGADKVYLQVDGMSYNGKYIDYTIVDSRLPVSESVAFVAVKNPKLNSSISYISAYDSHGRICRPYCHSYGSYSNQYKTCSGVINLTEEKPKLYGEDVGEVTRLLYKSGKGKGFSRSDKNIFLSFYCDFHEMPWGKC
ncbi:unnamed protein product [Mytilus edulis]|uniref:Tyrosinase copper-binding domain-containing protein n=1 Tax=Mytilus edulis TaxID=6550 RepID=A0A8S3Q668_MYTED|nr:unnamed protein product [Mytilus edulis]